jgi:hypothetical protein
MFMGSSFEFLLVAARNFDRHCERSEAIHGTETGESWIASSLALPCANALRLSQAMTAGG